MPEIASTTPATIWHPSGEEPLQKSGQLLFPNSSPYTWTSFCSGVRRFTYMWQPAAEDQQIWHKNRRPWAIKKSRGWSNGHFARRPWAAQWVEQCSAQASSPSCCSWSSLENTQHHHQVRVGTSVIWDLKKIYSKLLYLHIKKIDVTLLPYTVSL